MEKCINTIPQVLYAIDFLFINRMHQHEMMCVTCHWLINLIISTFQQLTTFSDSCTGKERTLR